MTAPGPPPSVSIAIPLHRSARFVDLVSANIERIADPDAEILVSDRTRCDDALDVLRQRHGADPRIRFLSGADALGWVDHYNLLLRSARGRYFVWMPHDDDFPAGYVSLLTATLDAHPDALLAFGALELLDPEGCPIEAPYLQGLPIPLGGRSRSAEVVALVEHWNLGIPFRGVFRRDEVLRRRLSIRHTLHDVDADAYWVVAIVAAGPIVFEPAVTCTKHVQRRSASSQWPRRRATVGSRLAVVPVVARYLLAARVPARDFLPILGFVTARAVAHGARAVARRLVRAVRTLPPPAVRDRLPSDVRREVGRQLRRTERGWADPDHTPT